jgi:hypothetical protein
MPTRHAPQFAHRASHQQQPCAKFRRPRILPSQDVPALFLHLTRLFGTLRFSQRLFRANAKLEGTWN